MNRDEISNLNPNAIVWDGLDEAIICLAKRESINSTKFYDNNGEIDVNLDLEYYGEFEDGEDKYDTWGRDSFDGVVVYNINTIIDILVRDIEISEDDIIDGSSKEETKYMMALEYFEYNISGGFVGKHTPIHIVIEKE